MGCVCQRPIVTSLTRLSELLSGRHVDTNGELAAVNRAFVPAQLYAADALLGACPLPGVRAGPSELASTKSGGVRAESRLETLVFPASNSSTDRPDDEPLRFRRLRARVEWSRDHPRALPMARQNEWPGSTQRAIRRLRRSCWSPVWVYNAPLLENWIYDSPDQLRCRGKPARSVWRHPVRRCGEHQLATHYDVRQSYSFPRTSPPTPLGQRVRTLHFLHGTGSPTESTWTATYSPLFRRPHCRNPGPLRQGCHSPFRFAPASHSTGRTGAAWSGFMAGPDGRLRRQCLPPDMEQSTARSRD